MQFSFELQSIIMILISFVGGGFAGWFLRGILDKRHGTPSSESAFIVGVVVSIWAISVLVDIIDSSYDTSPLLHGIMGAIVGFFFKPWNTKK